MASNRKTKEEIISLLIEHSRIIYSVISDMGVYYSTWSDNFELNQDDLEKKKNKMQLSEEEADEIKIRLIQDFSDTGASGLGNFINLVLRMDNVINYPLEFVEMLPKIKLDPKIFQEIKPHYHKLINQILEMADALKTVLKYFRDTPKKVFDMTTKIHEYENYIDTLYRQFLEFLYSNEKIDLRNLLRIRDSIVLLEQLADRIHDIADVMRVLLYQ
ncbi:MAG: DUF47 family protein [Candidatus Lokiarchaeota archaeon]|nr:DUF47 family protein [Candidatus Lokiarchaeota archaeon]